MNSLTNGSTQEKIIKSSYIWKITLTSKWLSNWFSDEFIHTKNHLNEQVVIEIGFLQLSSIWKKLVVSKIIIHVHFKWVEKILRIKLLLLGKKSTQKQLMTFLKQNHQSFFTFFNFTADSTQQKSPSFSKFTLDYHNSNTQNHPYSKTREEYHMDNPYPHTTKTTRDHVDDGIMETI